MQGILDEVALGMGVYDKCSGVCRQCAYFNQCIGVHSIAALVYKQIID